MPLADPETSGIEMAGSKHNNMEAQPKKRPDPAADASSTGSGSDEEVSNDRKSVMAEASNPLYNKEREQKQKQPKTKDEGDEVEEDELLAARAKPETTSSSSVPAPAEAEEQDDDEYSNYAKYSLICFSLKNPVRKACLKIANSNHFNTFVLCCIMCNAFLMGMADYSHVNAQYEPGGTNFFYVASLSAIS